MKPIRMPSPFTQVIIGLCFGVVFGLFFGEDILVIDNIGIAYIRLLQMSVLPYVVASLVSSIGRLSAERAIRIGKAGGLLILVLFCQKDSQNSRLNLMNGLIYEFAITLSIKYINTGY